MESARRDPEAARRAHAAARRHWPIRTYRLGEEPSDDLSATTSAAERLEMMWPLAREAWELTGRPVPDYRRQEAPIRVLHRDPSPTGECS